MITAILVDGAFYLKRAYTLFGSKPPKERADELITYCYRHLKNDNWKSESIKSESTRPEFSKLECNDLYRIFYYDCPPSDKNVYHPLLQKNIPLKKSKQYIWSNDFHKSLISKRKVAFRRGELLESVMGYSLKPETLKKLCRKEITIEELSEADFFLDITQKGVDMKIGLDISSLSYKRIVNQIVLIAGDSDFVPAAKHARREGIDFILDPMWHNIKPSLNEHIDGLRSCVCKPPENLHDPLCVLPQE